MAVAKAASGAATAWILAPVALPQRPAAVLVSMGSTVKSNPVSVRTSDQATAATK